VAFWSLLTRRRGGRGWGTLLRARETCRLSWSPMFRGLKRLAKEDKAQDSSDLKSALDQVLTGSNRTSDLLELADLFNDISGLGEAEKKACIQVLTTFAEYRKTTSAPRRFR